jgi:hypothetical protein
MKRFLYKSFKPLILFLFAVNLINAQDVHQYGTGNTSNPVNTTNTVSKVNNASGRDNGTVMLDGFYGFPNAMFEKWNSSTVTYNNYSHAKNNSLGPAGGRIEFMLSRRIGVGIEGSYAHTGISYLFADDSNSVPKPYSVTINRFRILPRFIFHIGKNPRLDPYAAAGIGYYNRTIVFTPKNPANGLTNLTTGDVFGPLWPFSDLLLPIAVTAKFGLRYFITEQIGIGVEVGIGGPLASFGLTAKIR